MIKHQIETELPIVLINNCLQTISDTEFGVSELNKDKGGKCTIVPKDGAGFEVNNPQQKAITFWAIDDCTFSSKDGKRCDFAIFDDETFAFAEIKRSKAKNRQQARNDASTQLNDILNFCKKKMDFQNFNILAIIALTFSKSYPIAKTRRQDTEIAFFNKYRANLLEGNASLFPYKPPQ